jgi:hypothetical protein
MQFLKETIPGAPTFTTGNGVYMEAGHICIKKDLADKIFGPEQVVLTVYYAANQTFLMAPPSEQPFRMIHKATQQILKKKNAWGDRSVAIQELLLDNEDIKTSDRVLEYIAEESLHLLTIKF